MARFFAVAMSHAPGLSGTPDVRPLLERRDERVLRELFGDADVAHDPREPGDEPRRLDPKDRVNRALRLGARHDPLAHHVSRPAQAQARDDSRCVGKSIQGSCLDVGDKERQRDESGGTAAMLVR